MSETVKMPRTFKVSKGAAEKGRAAVNPDPVPPSSAKENTDKDGTIWKRWVETGSIEAAYREASKDGTLVVYVLGLKARPGEPNQHKTMWFRFRIHPDIAEGREVSDTVQSSYGWMTERALAATIALIDITGFTPKQGDGGISGSLLETLFPLKAQMRKSPLVGKSVAAKLVHKKLLKEKLQPNQREEQTEAEMFLPPVPIPGVPAAMQ